MFDEKKEAVDIFADVDSAGAGGAPRPMGVQPSAQGGLPSAAEPSRSRGPSKLIFIVVVLLVLGGVGGGVWYFVLRNKKTHPPMNSPATEEVTEKQPSADEPEMPTVPVCGNAVCEPGEEQSCPADCGPLGPVCGDGVCEAVEDSNACPADCLSLPTEPVIEPEPANEPLDTDRDGLGDDIERSLGTNPEVADTDADGLSDREEVAIYKTNPTNPDTDGDGYLDGDEVKAGYNPSGPGKLLNLPQ